LTVNGNLDISNNAVVEITGSGTLASGGGKLHLKGNLNNQGLIISSGVIGTINEFELNGASNQNINTTGITGPLIEFIINNPSGATLLSPLILPHNLQLTSGKIQTSTTNLLTMIDNATYTGGSSTSFIEGPMKKIGDEDFIFPIGIGSIYTPLGILAGTGATSTDEFTARYFRLSPQSTFGTTYAGGINHISFVEYWDLVKGTSTPLTKKISLTVTAQSFCANIASTFISHLVGGVWSNEPSVSNLTGTVPPYELGTITTTGDFSVFGPFTLATNLPFNSNPLPIKLISFNAIKSSSNVALLKWELAACCSDAAKFEIEKSTDSGTFVAFDKVPGSLTNRFYTLPDNRLGKGITYYRLKMIDEDGTITYSKTVALINDETGLLITSLSPNPVQSNATIAISVAKACKLNLSICDLSGKIVKQWNASITEGNNSIPVNTEGLASGVYHIIASGNNNKAIFRFIKQ
jgi:Secretion system C-terminal sorting domain